MDSEWYPFTLPQYIQLKDAILHKKKILFIGLNGAGKTYAMYRLVSLLRQETTEDFRLFEFDSEAELFSLPSTIISRFGLSKLPPLLGDSVGCVRVFSEIIPMYTYPILALCKEPEALMAALVCRYPEDAKTVLKVNVGEAFEPMADKAFDYIVHVQRTNVGAIGAPTVCVNVMIYDA